VESPLSVKILQGEFADGDTVTVDYEQEQGVVFRRTRPGTPVELTEEVPAKSA
jgi:hypothetical protein